MLLFWAGCKTNASISNKAQDPPQYSLIYLVHADADYSFYDGTGNRKKADKKVIEEAKMIGEQALKGEVFIFYQRPERKFLWLFPKKDRLMLHYRNGELVRKHRYSPGDRQFSAESEFYANYSYSDISSKYLFYFGHEIPSENKRFYHRSRPAVEVSTTTFTKGITSFLPDNSDNKFDLVVLSTCNNGTPGMVNQFHPITEFLLASPQNLHLSHIDTENISVLESSPLTSGKDIAKKMAKSTFEQLSASVQTVISLSVYEMKNISRDIERRYNLYQEKYLPDNSQYRSTDNTDCLELPFFSDVKNESRGISTWFRSSKFGREANIRSHSGWGCPVPNQEYRNMNTKNRSKLQ